jgi:hypothetical protein
MDKKLYRKICKFLRLRYLKGVIAIFKKHPFKFKPDEWGIDWEWRSFVSIACECNYLEAIKWFAENGVTEGDDDWRKPYEYEYPHLVWAIRNGDLEVVKFLVEQGVDVNEEITDEKELKDCADLESKYKDLSWYDRLGWANSEFPLDVAFLFDELDIADYLISKGARLASDLFIACQDCNLSAVKYLVEHGADINAKDRWDMSVVDYIFDLDILEYLLMQGIDLGQHGRSLVLENFVGFPTAMDKAKMLLDKMGVKDEI